MRSSLLVFSPSFKLKYSIISVTRGLLRANALFTMTSSSPKAKAFSLDSLSYWFFSTEAFDLI